MPSYLWPLYQAVFKLHPPLSFQTFWKHFHMLFHHFGLYQTTEDCVGYDTSEERAHKCIYLSTAFHGYTRQVA